MSLSAVAERPPEHSLFLSAVAERVGVIADAGAGSGMGDTSRREPDGVSRGAQRERKRGRGRHVTPINHSHAKPILAQFRAAAVRARAS